MLKSFIYKILFVSFLNIFFFDSAYSMFDDGKKDECVRASVSTNLAEPKNKSWVLSLEVLKDINTEELINPR